LRPSPTPSSNTGTRDETRLDDLALDRLLAAATATPDRSLNLRPYRFLSTSAITSLAALLSDNNPPFTSLLIDDHGTRTYLARAGFFEQLDNTIRIEPPLQPSETFHQVYRGGNINLLELTQLDATTLLPTCLDQIVAVLRTRLRYKRPDAYDTAIMISEVSQNIADHATSAHGYLMLQVFGKGTKRFLQIGIADSGCGIKQSLQKNPRFHHITGDATALRCATSPGTSEFTDQTRGTGLYHLLRITISQQGMVRVQSGDGVLVHKPSYARPWITTASTRRPGTHVAITLPTHRRPRTQRA
jgi:hypothetical protein